MSIKFNNQVVSYSRANQGSKAGIRFPGSQSPVEMLAFMLNMVESQA